MEKQIQSRLKELQEEYKKGQEQLNALEQQTTNIKASMLRISGAIQVLEELTVTRKKEDNEENQKSIEKVENLKEVV